MARICFLTWANCALDTQRSTTADETCTSIGFKQLRKTIGEVKLFPETFKFLLAYFLYNDGIQTVIRCRFDICGRAATPRRTSIRAANLDRGDFDDPVCCALVEPVLGKTCRMDRRKTISDRKFRDLAAVCVIYAYGGLKRSKPR